MPASMRYAACTLRQMTGASAAHMLCTVLYGFRLLPTERHDRRLFLPMATVERLFAG